MKRVHEAGGEWAGYDPVLREHAKRVEIPWFTDALALTGPKREMVQALERFRQRGYRQIVISDYDGQYKLEALGIGHYFDCVFAGEDKGIFKPATDIFMAACCEMAIRPQELLHIGDREDTDGVAARQAGCSVEII